MTVRMQLLLRHCQTIPRVRNPIYTGEIAFLKNEF